MAWAFGAALTSGSDKVAGTGLTMATINATIGHQIIAWVSFDNTGTSTPTISSLTVPGGESATWSRLTQHDSSTATSGAGVRGEVWGIVPTQTWTTFAIVVTFSASITAKAYGVVNFTGGILTAPRGTGASGTSTSGSPSLTCTLTGVSQPQNGDLVLMLGSHEDPTSPGIDVDTTNGSWFTGAAAASSGGSSTANVGGRLGYKIVNATGDQTCNPGSATGDSGVCAIALAPTAPTAAVPPLLVMAPRAA